MNFISIKIKKWYIGAPDTNEHFSLIGFYERHSSAVWLDKIGHFIENDYKWIIGLFLAVAAILAN